MNWWPMASRRRVYETTVRYGIRLGVSVTFLCSLSFGSGPLKKGPYLQWLLTTSVTIMWETYSNVSSDCAYSVGDSVWMSVAPTQSANVFSATLTRLNPDTKYFYRIRTDTVWSPTNSFKTAPLFADTVRFGWLADVRPPNYDTVYVRMEMVLKRLKQFQPDLFIVGGDMVDRGDANGLMYQDQWTGYFKGLSVLASSVGYWPVLGNHEEDYDSAFSNFFQFHHILPRRGYYSFTYGNVHIIVLSIAPCEPGSKQYQWLVNDLQTAYYDPEVKAIFVAMHYPYYSSGEYSHFPYIRQYLYPLFELYAVSAVFSGHDHIYERSYRLIDDQESETGITYFVSGGGGSWMLDYNGGNWWTARLGPEGQFLHCLVVECVGDTCTVKCIAVDPAVPVPYDSVRFASRRLYNTDSVVTPKLESQYTLPRIRAFPNPAKGLLYLLYDLSDEPEATIDVYNLLGQSVHHLDLRQSNGAIGYQRFDMGPLPSGLYFCVLRTDRGVSNVPIVHFH